MGRSVGRAAVVGRYVKLVHQRIESGEAGTFWPMLPVTERVERVCHDSAEWGAAIAQDVLSPGAGSITRWFTLRRPWETAPWLPFHKPFAQVRTVVH